MTGTAQASRSDACHRVPNRNGHDGPGNRFVVSMLAVLLIPQSAGAIFWYARQRTAMQAEIRILTEARDLGARPVVHPRETSWVYALVPTGPAGREVRIGIMDLPVALNDTAVRRHALHESANRRRLVALLAKLDHIDLLLLRGWEIDDEWMDALSRLANVQEVEIRNASVTDRGIAALAKMRGVRSVSIDNAPVSDECLLHLARMETVDSLAIRGTLVSKHGLRYLQRMGSLRCLELVADVSNEALPYLLALRQLTRLEVGRTHIDDFGRMALVLCLPRTEVLPPWQEHSDEPLDLRIGGPHDLVDWWVCWGVGGQPILYGFTRPAQNRFD